MIGLDELEQLLQARAAEIQTLLQAARESPNQQTLANLNTCLQAGARLQQNLSHVRSRLSGELHYWNQLNQNPHTVPGDPGQPGVQTLELHG